MPATVRIRFPLGEMGARMISHADNRSDDRSALLQVTGLTKNFGTLTACDAIDLTIERGEIHALLGENGAGKSTLVKMLFGALAPDSGSIRWEGRPVHVENPAFARQLGVGMIFQHFSLFEALTVADNVALGLDGRLGGSTLDRMIRDVSAEYGLPIDPDASVADLSVGERQRVEIVRCLLQEPRLLIMDEPTSVLTPQEARLLFTTLRRLADDGVSILYITHRLAEVLEIAGSATILRRGKVVAAADPRQETAASLARMMIGEALAGPAEMSETASAGYGAVRLAVDNADLPADGRFAVALKDICLSVRGGEIVCIAGVAGNGQQELFDLISGERRLAVSETIRIDGHAVGTRDINDRRRLGAAFVPEERIGHSAAAGLSLSENVILTHHPTSAEINRRGWINRAAARRTEERIGDAFDVRRAHADPLASSLSGGNLQKFVVGREIDRKPGILVINQPTWGVDPAAATRIRLAVRDLARNGSAVLVISQDLDEIFEIADSIIVISDGRLSASHPAGEMTFEQIGLLMGGIHGESSHAA